MKRRPEVPLCDAPEPVMRAAGAWLAKQDRGLTREEAATFARWRTEDPSHEAAVAQLSQTMSAFDRIAELAPDFSPRPDPDAFAPRRGRKPRWFLPAVGLAAAAALAVIVFRPMGSAEKSPAHYATAAGGYQRATLPDGSVVDLNSGTVLDLDFTPAERRIRLSQGEAHFQVSKNPNRPFIVSAEGVSVRAVGTAFDVRLSSHEVAVLVTEGLVHVARGEGEGGRQKAEGGRGNDHVSLVTSPDTLSLSAGQSVVVPLASSAPVPQAAAVTTAEIDRQLAWQPRLMELRKTPLAEIVAELNQHAGPGQPRLVIEDPELAAFRIGGNFRADQADAFVRLLETSFDVTAEQKGDTIVLRKAR